MDKELKRKKERELIMTEFSNLSTPLEKYRYLVEKNEDCFQSLLMLSITSIAELYERIEKLEKGDK